MIKRKALFILGLMTVAVIGTWLVPSIIGLILIFTLTMLMYYGISSIVMYWIKPQFTNNEYIQNILRLIFIIVLVLSAISSMIFDHFSIILCITALVGAVSGVIMAYKEK